MGLVTSQIRLLFLTFREHDLGYKMQLISRTKMGLANSSSELLKIGTDLDPDSPELKILEQRREKLMQMEKKLDAELELYKTQLKAVDAEKQSVQKQLDKAIKSFSY